MYIISSMMLLMLSLAFVFLVLGKSLSKKNILDRDSQSPFECGFSTFMNYRLSFSLHFFLVALVFIIFDVELIILFPYFFSSHYHHFISGLFMFISFLSILTLGLFNEWNQSVLEWQK